MLTTLATAAPYFHGGGFPFFVFPAFSFLFLVPLVVFAVSRRGGWRAVADARAVLADRFARGDISAEEYRARLSELSRK
ncbi:SHOCT domain-containing protein [Curtobacterium sp. 9128]|uniref:SHOCT domain-containing protein n=1 Tax=Curtobacterium sp. 9128 TaxID=1793722 RepID=UPI0011A1FACA|nr:SHOCT domain-containing protein [Curtobacterium sp. 9128]